MVFSVGDRVIVGDRVRIGGRFLRGHTGTLVRPTHLLLKKAWVVEFDNTIGFRRTRVVERILEPLQE
jgi:hypothetical protein